MRAWGRVPAPRGSGGGAGARLSATARVTARVLARSGLSTWAPSGRTHLLGAACSGLLALVSMVSLYPFEVGGASAIALSGLGLALVSVWPLGGAILCLVAACCSSMSGFPLPAVGPWLCASVLVSRGFHRALAYGVAACGAALAHLSYRLDPPSVYEGGYTTPFTEAYLYTLLLGAACLVVAELIRQPRRLAEAAAERHEADLERQRLLVVSELHDTVVRDLSQAVMLAEQARLAHPEDAALSPALASMTASVRASVDRLRSSLRAMNEAGGGAGMDVLASSAPRPLAEVVAEARAVMAGRGADLAATGLGLLDAPMVSPGVRQQLVRVLGELVSNMAKYAAPGPARLVIEADGLSLEAMATNAVAPQDGTSDLPAPSASSGLGLEGARRRVESLGGTFSAIGSAERFTVILSVPLAAGRHGA